MLLMQPKINSVPLRSYRAELIDYSVGSCDYQNAYIKPASKTFPVRLQAQVGMRPIALTMDIYGESDREIAMQISRLTFDLNKAADLELPDGFYYWSVLDNISTPSKVAPWIWQITVSLNGVRHGRLETALFTESGRLTVGGNLTSPAIVKLTPREAGKTMYFNNISVQYDSPVVIDGVNTTVMDSNGINVFGYASMTEWPKLVPGENQITVSNADAVVSYYPIYF